MPRYKEYNEIRVTEKAMYQFWQNGYGASSLSDLIEVMNINKFSFYDAFNTKEDLLLRTIRHYLDTVAKPELEQLRSDKNMIAWLRNKIKNNAKGIPGCYILTITAETGVSIKGAVKILEEYISLTEEVLGEIILHHDPHITEDEMYRKKNQLMGLFTSIPLMHPVKPTRSSLEYAENVLSVLDMNQNNDYAQTS